MTAFDLVAFDIETTGFAVDDRVTVVGFAFPMVTRVFVATPSADGDDAATLEQRVRDRTSETVTLSTHADEAALLEAVSAFGHERFAGADDLLLVAYNGEKWRSGFDLPFLRTRLSRHDIAWPFRDVPYADLLPVIERRFNTAMRTDDGRTGVNDLVGAYDTLLDGPASDMDPFEESSEAVAAFEAGRYAALVAHNVADVRRTQALGTLAQTYCSKSDISLKSLTPTIYDD